MNYTPKLNQFPPKTEKQIKRERKEFIREYLEGNLFRFLRRHHTHNQYELVFSKVFKRWRKEGNNKLVEYIIKNYEWPEHVCEIVNVMRTLVKYYGYKYDRKCLNVGAALLDMFQFDIDEYWKEHYYKRCQEGRFYTLDQYTEKEAFAEQKARGYIHVNEFQDYHKGSGHVFSNIDRYYVYPTNFYTDYLLTSDVKSGSQINVYVGLSLVGVGGWTRAELPKHLVNTKENSRKRKSRNQIS